MRSRRHYGALKCILTGKLTASCENEKAVPQSVKIRGSVPTFRRPTRSCGSGGARVGLPGPIRSLVRYLWAQPHCQFYSLLCALPPNPQPSRIRTWISNPNLVSLCNQHLSIYSVIIEKMLSSSTLQPWKGFASFNSLWRLVQRIVSSYSYLTYYNYATRSLQFSFKPYHYSLLRTI